MYKKMGIQLIICTICIGAVFAQIDPSASDALQALPADIQDLVNNTQIQDIQNKTTRKLKEKCENNGGPDAYTNLEGAVKSFTTCVQDLINFSTLNEEIEKAKPDGRVDEVFKKYCDKRPVLLNCFHNLTEVLETCLTAEEQQHVPPFVNMTHQLAEFICFKDGDRIALFIAEKGPECLQEKSAMINECLNNTFIGKPSFDKIPDEIPEIKFGEKECNQLTKAQSCVVAALETCAVPTSANIIESLFKFARKSLPCKEMPETKKPNSGSRVGVASLTIVAAIAARILV
ncbi:PREDICTED: 27 kDa hemolymph protein-like isoform X2 [Papilio polytes]|uniref:27 kDa hemolymph protein-like isoform X2 n=1 Tax=Papilio polytes TaxID=76194 RepID=UPI000675F970|nr:PREDICTED: 27 kDa hemolymph protein-like isoform X2 [Papilio polytes]